MHSDCLNLTEKSHIDDSIVKVTNHSYVPHNTLNINNSDEIRISINNQDLLKLPCKSYLYIRGKIEHHDKGYFIQNAFAFLFDEIRYLIANKEVDVIRNPGITSLLKIRCSYNS